MRETTGSIASASLFILVSSFSSKFQVYPVEGRYLAQTLNAEHAPVISKKQRQYDEMSASGLLKREIRCNME